MPLYRSFFNKKGPTIPEPVEPTRRIARAEPADKARPAPPSPSESLEPTRRISRPNPADKARPAAPSLPEPVEQPPRSAPAEPADKARPAAPAIHESLNILASPVVGWLAIIAGPGRGEILRLGYGVNDIGSGPNARVRLDFGDPAIAPENHAAIIYAARSRRFYLAHSVTAEIELNGQPVQESVELTSGDTVGMGQTQLRFVPLCGPGFDWRDVN